MALATRCPACQASLRLEESAIGRRVRCSKCRHAFQVSSVSFAQSTADNATVTVSPETVGPPPGSSTILAAESMSLPGTPPDAARMFGRFKIVSVLGQGTYGQVFRAFDPTLDREVALKIPKFGSGQTRLVERFLREAKAAAHLRHPNIVAVFESGRVGDDYYIASEFVDGETLSTRIEREPVSPADAANWCRDLANALAYAHANGVVHRDIKPGNILMDRSARPQITDFGLAKRIDEDTTMTTEGGLLGTPAYMSPEQARGETEKIGPASDQYSLGVVLYELLTGQRPFDGPPHVVIAKAAGSDPPPAPRTIRPSIPRDLEAICLHALEKDPARRYRQVGGMGEDLDRWLEGRPVRVRRISEIERFTRWCRRNPLLASSLAITLALIIAAIGGAFTRVIIQLEKAEQVAVEAQKATQVETVASQAAQRQLAVNEFERGRKLCEQGELTQGLLWLASSLSSLTPEISDLERPIRSYLGSWLPHVHQLRLIIPHETRVNSVVISPDGKWLLTGEGKETEPGRVQLWNIQTGVKIGPPIEHGAGVTQVAFAPNGALIATASVDKTVRLIEPATGRVVHTLVHPDSVWCAAFSPDGKRLATGCSDEFARMWDVGTGVEGAPRLHHPRPHPGDPYNSAFNKQPSVERLAFSPDGTKLATTSGDRRLRIWNLAKGEVEAGPVRGYANWYFPFAYHPGGGKLLTQVELLIPVGAQFRDTATLTPTGPVFNHKTRLANVRCTPDGRSIITAGETTARIWDAETGEQIGQSLLQKMEIFDTCFSPDQKTVVTAGLDGVTRVWNFAENTTEGKTFHNNTGAGVHFLPDGRSFLTSDFVTPDPEDNRPARERLWDCRSGNQVAGPFNHAGALRSIAFTLDGTVYARGNWQSAQLFRTDTGAEIHQPLMHPNVVLAVAFTPDESILATGCADGLVRFWDRATKTVIEPSLKHEKRVNKIEFSRDGKLLLTIGEDAARLWDWKARTEVGPALREPLGVRTAALHPDGKIVAVASNDGTVRFWNVADGTPLNRLIANLELVNVVCFLPDGKSLLTSGSDGSTHIWDYATCLPAARPFQRNGRVEWTDINRDGTLIVTGGSDPIVHLYDVPQPVTDTPRNFRRRLERLLGAELGSGQQVRVLDTKEWQQRADPSENGRRELPGSAAGDPPQPAVAPINPVKKPNKPITNFNDPAFKQWQKGVAALPAEQQVEAVAQKLVELNPEFDGKFTGYFPKSTLQIENGVVTEFGFLSDNVTDITPVRALRGLNSLSCEGSGWPRSPLSDLSPLKGMRLVRLRCGATEVSDLSPLKGMRLIDLCCQGTFVMDLSPLKGMKLMQLKCGWMPISDFSPLKGMPLNHLDCGFAAVADFSPLRGMPLTTIYCYGTNVSDLSPLHHCKDLTILNITRTKVTAKGVAALQKALPNCKIQQDDAPKPKTPNTPAQ